ncbi:HAD family hydrolase [Candidatus Micrarchaeota archaeon]|nr:HAD family hydrolase [Candidatus Micrarchaeota archaeon]
MIKVVIFDLDETLLRLLVDWENARQAVIAYGKEKQAVFDAKEWIIPISEKLSTDEKTKEEVDAIWKKHELSALEEKGVERYPIAEGYVKELKEKELKLAIFSNNCHDTIQKALEKAELLKYFDFIVGRDDVEKTKPNPEGIFKILEHFQIKAPEAVLYGDSENDSIAGENAKIKTFIIRPKLNFPRF